MRVEERGWLGRSLTVRSTAVVVVAGRSSGIFGVVSCGVVGVAATVVVSGAIVVSAGLCGLTIILRMLLLGLEPILMRKRVSAHARRATETRHDVRARALEKATRITTTEPVLCHPTIAKMVVRAAAALAREGCAHTATTTGAASIAAIVLLGIVLTLNTRDATERLRLRRSTTLIHVRTAQAEARAAVRIDVRMGASGRPISKRVTAIAQARTRTDTVAEFPTSTTASIVHV